jgi:outer membrane lipoprotein SlyB
MPANKWLLSLMVPAALALGLGACNQTGGATPPGIVNTSSTGSYSGDSGRVMAIREVAVRAAAVQA